MSFEECDGQVVLTMSREDFEKWTRTVMFDNYPLERMNRKPELYRNWKTQHAWEGWQAALAHVDRLNSRNPNYRPYQTGEKES